MDENDSNYNEWLQKIHKAAGVTEKKVVDEVKREEKAATKFLADKQFKNSLLLFIGIFLLALVPRLIYMFFFSDPLVPGWYTDTFHHWQIAYLSREVGYSHGFLRLWDFKGMEFFWGLLHPLVLDILFTITGSTSIIIPKLLSAVGGSVSIAFLFLLVRRYFNTKAAWATVLFATFFPLTLFSNTVGMQEELAMPLVLGALLLWPGNAMWSGVLLALASMVRAEYWLFSMGLVITTVLLRRDRNKVIALVVTYGAIMALYAKYLISWTGNPIYPIYWNFLASVKGDWFADLPVIGEKLLAKYISQGIFAFGLVGALITFWKRPKHSLLFFFGFGNLLFIGFMVGFGAYVKGYIRRFWVDRLYDWPYVFTAILLILLLFYVMPKKLPLFDKLKLNWIILFAGLVVSQWLWNPIRYYITPMQAMIAQERHVAAEIGSAYKGGVVLLPEDRQMVTYFLVQDYHISGKQMEGQMFDPFFYFPDAKHPFSNWGKDRIVVLNWLKNDNIQLIALTADKATYKGLIQREPQHFIKLPSDGLVQLYQVVF